MGNLASLTAAAMLVLWFAGEVLAGGVSCPAADFVIVGCQRDSEGDFTVYAFSDNGSDAPSGISVDGDCTEALDLLYNSDDPRFFLLEATSGSTDKTVYTWLAGCD
jgi:hypothetical protein